MSFAVARFMLVPVGTLSFEFDFLPCFTHEALDAQAYISNAKDGLEMPLDFKRSMPH